MKGGSLVTANSLESRVKNVRAQHRDGGLYRRSNGAQRVGNGLPAEVQAECAGPGALGDLCKAYVQAHMELHVHFRVGVQPLDLFFGKPRDFCTLYKVASRERLGEIN